MTVFSADAPAATGRMAPDSSSESHALTSPGCQQHRSVIKHSCTKRRTAAAMRMREMPMKEVNVPLHRPVKSVEKI